jgi:hypothetical protein
VKLNTSSTPAVGHGFTDVADFKMDMNAKAARVLSDTLYKDKHGSIIRELCSNAFDAHKMVGKGDVPFDLTLPDAFSPMLTIRDYGPGISPDDIKTVYSTYFASTKDNENDSVGAFGLGSKTPFSLTDSFMVTSIYDGVKRVYNAFMDEGKPRITQFGKAENTDEPNGLEVSITVDKDDVSTFREAVRKQLRFFPVKPNVSPSVDWPEITDTLIDVDGFTYFQHNNELLLGFFIKTGPVAYPVDFDVLNSHYQKLGKGIPALVNLMENMANNRHTYGYGYSARREFHNKGAVLDMPIGTVEVTPSREGLSYSKATLDNIVNAIEIVKDNLFDTVRDRMKDEYDKGYKEFIEYFDKLDSVLLDSVKDDYIEKHFDPFVITDSNLFIKMPEKFVDLEVKEYRSSYKGKAELVNTIELAHLWKSHTRNLTIDDNGESTPMPFTDTQEYLRCMRWLVNTALSDETIFLKDENYAFAQRAFDYNSANGGGPFRVIDTNKCEATLKDVHNFISKFVDDDERLIYISDTAKPVKASSGGHSITGGKKRSWFDLTKLHNLSFLYKSTLYKLGAPSEFSQTIDDLKNEPDNSYVFFTTFNNRVEEPEKGPEITKALFNYIRSLDSVKIIAVPKNQRKKYEKIGAAIHVDDFVKKHLDKIKTAAKKELNISLVDDYNSRAYNSYHTERDLLNNLRTLVSDSSNANLPEFEIVDRTDTVTLSGMSQHEVETLFRVLDIEDVYEDFKQVRVQWSECKNIDEAEKILNDLDLPFESFKERIDTLKDELVNEKNYKKFLIAIATDDWIGEYQRDPFGTSVLLNPRELAVEVIERIA